MQAIHVDAFHDAVERFEAEASNLRSQLDVRASDLPRSRSQLERAVGSLLDSASALESELTHAPEIVREIQARFRERCAALLGQSWLIDRSVSKPRGYAGDHAMLDALYLGRTVEGGIGKLLDEMVLGCAAGRAVVARKRFAKEWLAERLARHPHAKVVDLACGPCRLEKELLDARLGVSARFIALDSDEEALAYAERVLGEHASRVQLRSENAIRIARDRGPSPVLAGAHYVVSLGLFDYLPRTIAVGLLRALRRSASPGAELLIGNFARGNPSRVFMEWMGDWALIYRSEEEFLDLFRDAGFAEDDLSLERESQDGAVLLATARVAQAAQRYVKDDERPAVAAAS